jgi:hypothetical protein
MTGVDDSEEWHGIQNMVCEAFGLNTDSRLVLSVVDAEGDEILMYVQMQYISLHCDRTLWQRLECRLVNLLKVRTLSMDHQVD